MTSMVACKTEQYLGDKAGYLLNFSAPKISKDRLHLPGPDFVDPLFAGSDRNNRVLGNLQRMCSHGRLAHTGYLSILPVDQGIDLVLVIRRGERAISPNAISGIE